MSLNAYDLFVTKRGWYENDTKVKKMKEDYKYRMFDKE